MKKIALLFFTFGIVAVSCKKEEKTEVPVTTEVEAGALKIVSDSTKVSWTAYKTTEKIGVGGSFTEITLNDTKTGTSPEAILEGATFSIPVSSLFTDNDDRDSKLKEFFFGVLKNKELISGTLNFSELNKIALLIESGIFFKEDFQKNVLQEAIKRTFDNRHTKYASDTMFFRVDFPANPSMQTKWKAFTRKITSKTKMPFSEICP